MAPRNRRTDADRREQTNASAQPFDSFHTGYLRIDEDHFYRTGIRGCKKYVLYCLVTFIFIVTLANLIVTVCVIGSFRISYKGAAAFEFVPPGVLWRVFYDVDTDSVAFSKKGKLGGRGGNEALSIDSYDSAVHINSNSGNQAKISVSPTGTTVTADRLKLVHPRTSKVMFSSDSISNHTLSEPRRTVSFGILHAAKLSSKVDGHLRVESDKSIYVTGMEGVNIEGYNLTMAGEEAVTFSATDGSVSVDGAKGISMITDPTSVGRKTFKVCVCAGNGRVFLSTPGTACIHSGADDPCVT